MSTNAQISKVWSDLGANQGRIKEWGALTDVEIRVESIDDLSHTPTFKETQRRSIQTISIVPKCKRMYKCEGDLRHQTSDLPLMESTTGLWM